MAIVLVSTFMHAGWNLLACYTRSEGEFYKKMLIITFPGGISAGSTLGDTNGVDDPAGLDLRDWFRNQRGFLSLWSGESTRAADFTIVYPLARAQPVIFIVIIDVTQGRYLTPAGWMGIILVVMGSALVPYLRS